MKTFVLLLLGCLIAAPTLASDASALRSAVESSTFLMEGNVDIIQVGQQTYLVSVAWSPIRGSAASARVAAMRTARVAAEEGLIKYIYPSRVEVSESVVASTRTGRDASGRTDRRRHEELATRIRDRSAGALPPLIEVGSWENADRKEQYAAVAIPVPP
jgi:hypothetical protein